MASIFETAGTTAPKKIAREIVGLPPPGFSGFKAGPDGPMPGCNQGSLFARSHRDGLMLVSGCIISDRVYAVLGRVVCRCINGGRAGPNQFIWEGPTGRMIVEQIAVEAAGRIMGELNAGAW